MTSAWRDFSLRGRLTTIVLALFIGSWLIAALFTTQSARIAFLNETDRSLQAIVTLADTVGSSVAAQVSALAAGDLYVGQEIRRDAAASDTRRLVQLSDVPGYDAQYAPRLNVWTAREQYLVGDDTPAFASPVSGLQTNVAMDQRVGQQQWRVLYRYNPLTDTWYGAGIDARQIRFGGTELLLALLLPLALVVPLTVIALYLGIATGLRPLDRLVDAIEERRRSAVLAPLAAHPAPREMRPVVASLNHLLERLAATLEDEQSFTANAAHELKTPLAAISAEVHLCQRLTQEADTRERMARILQRVDRASHSVNQLLILARLDPQESLSAAPVDLYGLLQDVTAEAGALASERHLQVQMNVPPSAVVAGDRDMLAILLRNMVINAFRYTPEGGVVMMAMDGDALVVSNDSPPVPEPARLTDRFYRGEAPGDAEAVPGTGLGLAIVLRICQLHRFAFSVDYRADERRFYATVDTGGAGYRSDRLMKVEEGDADTAG
jgi:signal transduction histidine kinase